MFKLSDIYGNDYKQQDQKRAVDTIINALANNIAHRTYDLRFESTWIWGKDYHISNDYILDMYDKIRKINKYLNIVHILDKNLLHTFVNSNCVEYFLIVDNQFKKALIIYITNENIGIL